MSATESADDAFEQIVKLARENALIRRAYGGVLLIVSIETQKELGIFEEIQYTHGLAEHPSRKNQDDPPT